MDKQEFSPKLRGVIKEIKEILEKHDIAGLVVVHEPGHSEFLMQMDTGYSCIKPIDGGMVHIKTDPDWDEEKRYRMLNDTHNMLETLAFAGDQGVQIMKRMLRVLETKTGPNLLGPPGPGKVNFHDGK